MAIILDSFGNTVHRGVFGEYNQVDYDAPLSEFSIYRNNDGSVTVFHPVIGTDTLFNIDGLWSDADQSWYSIEDAITLTPGAASVAPAAPAPAVKAGFEGAVLYSIGDDVLTGSATEYSQVDYDGNLSDFAISRNADGSVTVSHPTFGTDTLINVEGLWIDGDQSWYSIDDAIALTPDVGQPVAPPANDGFQGAFLYAIGDDILTGSATEYSQVDYDGNLSDFAISRNADGSVTVSHPTFGTDTLTNVEGLWIDGDQSWYSIDDAIALTPDVGQPAGPAPTVPTAPPPPPAPTGQNTGVLVDGVITGTNDVNDTLLGDGGNNTFFAGRGTDVIQGGAGNDTLRVDGDIFEWTFSANANGSVTMTHPTWGENTLTGIEQILSQRSGETFSIDDAIASTNGLPRFRLDNDNVINGTNGNDTIQGSAGVQGFYGGQGDDIFLGTNAFEQVNYDGARSEYNITQNADGSLTVDHPIWGTDTLTDIDGLIFTGVEPGVGGAQSAPFEFVSTVDLFG